MNFSNPDIQFANSLQSAEIALLLNKAYRGEDAKKGWTTESDIISGDVRTNEEEVRSLIENKNSYFILYLFDKKLSGCLNVQLQGDKLYLGMLSVEPPLQGKGIGKKLLLAAEEFAKENNCKACKMLVIDRRTELIDFYKRHGYNVTGEKTPFPSDGKSGIPQYELWFDTLEKKI